MAGLKAGAASLADLGYKTSLCLTDFGDAAESVLRKELQSTEYDCVMVGAGIRAVVTHFLLFEKMINVIHEHAPQAKICFNTNPADTAEAVKRWI